MSEIALLYVMAAFVVIAAIALCIQAGMLAGIYRTTKALQDSINPLLPKVESLVTKADATVEQSGKQITEITTRANDILDSTKRQLAIVEEVVGDAAARAKVQMERVELVIDDTLSRAHETVAVVHDGIMRPLREVSGIAAGVRAALGALARGNRATVDRATSDEEMFI
jgi:F0F1-type ATP synthase membrane subunit b/b'